MSFKFHTMRNLIKESAGFDLHLCTSDRALIASEYHDMLDEIEVDQPPDDEATHRVMNLYLMVHELVADLNLLQDLESTNDKVRIALSAMIHRYTVNVQGAASSAFFSATGEDKYKLNHEINREYRNMKLGHEVFHGDIVRLSESAILSKDGMWGDEKTSAFVSEKLLPRIHALDAQISENIAALGQQFTTETVELPPEVPRIGAQRATVNPVGMSIESIEAAKASGTNVVQLFPIKKNR